MIKFSILILSAGLAVAEWSYESQIDPITDESRTILYSEAESGTNPYGESPYLTILLFNYGRGRPRIDIGVAWGIEINSSDILCICRVDDGSPFEYTLLPDPSSPGGVTYFDPTDSSHNNYLFARLLKGDQFVVRFTPESSNTMTAVFSLAGLTAASQNAGFDLQYYYDIYDHYNIPSDYNTITLQSDGNGFADISLLMASDYSVTFDFYYYDGSTINANGIWFREDDNICIQFNQEDIDKLVYVFLTMDENGFLSFPEFRQAGQICGVSCWSTYSKE